MKYFRENATEMTIFGFVRHEKNKPGRFRLDANGRTDGHTDIRRDRPSHRDAREHLKIVKRTHQYAKERNKVDKKE